MQCIEKAIKALIKQDAYPEDMLTEIRKVTTQAQQFRAFTERCLHTMSRETNGIAKTTRDAVSKTLNLSTDTNDTIRILRSEVIGNTTAMSGIHLNTEAILTQGKKQMEALTVDSEWRQQQIRSSLIALNEICDMLKNAECRLGKSS